MKGSYAGNLSQMLALIHVHGQVFIEAHSRGCSMPPGHGRMNAGRVEASANLRSHLSLRGPSLSSLPTCHVLPAQARPLVSDVCSECVLQRLAEACKITPESRVPPDMRAGGPPPAERDIGGLNACIAHLQPFSYRPLAATFFTCPSGLHSEPWRLPAHAFMQTTSLLGRTKM